MLDAHDIQHIKDNREQLTKNRTDDVVLYREIEGPQNPFTGDPTYTTETAPSECTWRRYISQSPGTDDRKVVGGAIATFGDVFANFDLSVDLSGVTRIKHVNSGEMWVIRGIDTIGLGDPNRHYVLLGRER